MQLSGLLLRIVEPDGVRTGPTIRWKPGYKPACGDRSLPYDLRMSIESENIFALYERHADAWVQTRLLESTLYEKPWLDCFCALLLGPGWVLDCGCGAGEPIARYLNQCGYAVMGVDSSPAMVRMFQACLPEQRAVVADMRTLCLPETFHGILAWDSFFHLDHSH